MAETFHGYVETTQDVLLIFEGCRRGLIPRVHRRLQEKERRMIRSGSIFVFDERESGIKRWTDGLVWSPSRILGNFLIYRELDKRAPGEKKLSISSASSNDSRQRSYSADQTAINTTPTDRNRERRLVGSLSDSYRFRKDGLIKKTMSIIVNGVAQHLISYYLPNDIINNQLRTPSSVPELASLEISPDLLVKQNFRIPPMVEPPFDQSETSMPGNLNNSISPVESMSSSYVTDRRIHPFRSMSMGSLRNSNSYQTHNNLSTMGRPEMNTNQQNLMYSATSSFPQRVEADDNPNKLPNNNFAYYGNQAMPSIYNGSNSNNNNGSNNNSNSSNNTNSNNNGTSNNGFPPLPSPSSMTSSPNTPMLSPVRQSFCQTRPYPMSSTSSSSLPRFNTHRDSFDMASSNIEGRPSHSVHPHMVSEVNIYGGDHRMKADNIEMGDSANTSSPHIGQLLNPVHPLSANVVKATSEDNASSQQLFQTMGMANAAPTYPSYSADNVPATSTSTHNRLSFDSSKLPSIPSETDSLHHEPTTQPPLQSQPQQQDPSFNTYGGNYYFQRQQIHHPLNNTHSSTSTSTVHPMFRNGIVYPQLSSMNDESQISSESGTEPLMLK
ncbi:Gti1/Pac2 family-domain-containing protein [Choanephora cucurbitarum]|nr:Gti1/Pac2 family-domain-containing protein [Choanephora cucurbitarum]